MTFDVLPSITAALRSWCVIGAYALAARGYVRQTTDFDLMTTDDQALHESTWSSTGAAQYIIDIRRGDRDDPLAGVIRIVGPETSIDIVVAKYRWQQDVIDRAEVMTIRGIPLRIPTAADLILIKLFAGGLGDEHDILRLLEIGPREELIREIDAKITSLPDDMQQRWAGVRRQL